MSGPTYSASSRTVDGKTIGTFTFLGRQDRHVLDRAREITGLPIKRNQYRTGQPIPFSRTA